MVARWSAQPVTNVLELLARSTRGKFRTDDPFIDREHIDGALQFTAQPNDDPMLPIV